mgnify:CR=1 FL=1
MRSCNLKTTIHFEGNALARLAKLEYKKVFIIADPFIVSSGLINAVTKHLSSANIEYKIYSDVVPDPTIDKVVSGVTALVREKSPCIIAVGGGSYASFPPLSESRSTLNNNQGSQAYQMEHRTIYVVDSLQTRPLPSNDWWTYALVNPWTGKLWAYPALVWADATGISIAKPSYWEPTGCEMKWNAPLTITTLAFSPDSLIASSSLLASSGSYLSLERLYDCIRAARWQCRGTRHPHAGLTARMAGAYQCRTHYHQPRP